MAHMIKHSVLSLLCWFQIDTPPGIIKQGLNAWNTGNGDIGALGAKVTEDVFW